MSLIRIGQNLALARNAFIDLVMHNGAPKLNCGGNHSSKISFGEDCEPTQQPFTLISWLKRADCAVISLSGGLLRLRLQQVFAENSHVVFSRRKPIACRYT